MARCRRRTRRNTSVLNRYLAWSVKEEKQHEQQLVLAVVLLAAGAALEEEEEEEEGAAGPGGLGPSSLQSLGILTGLADSDSEEDSDELGGFSGFGAGAGSEGEDVVMVGALMLLDWHDRDFEAEPRVRHAWPGGRAWEPGVFDNLCRFQYGDLDRLVAVLGLPEEMVTNHNWKFSGKDGLVLVLHRLATGNTLAQLAMSGYHRGSNAKLSEVFSTVCKFLSETHGDLLLLQNNARYLDEAKGLIHAKTGEPDVSGFVDCTFFRTCKPSGPDGNQRLLYSGYKRELAAGSRGKGC